MGSPAASAEVHVSGRSAFELRLNRAPPPAVHPDPTASLLAWYSSYNWHAPECTTNEWASEPASIGPLAGNGYGPGSLSSANSLNVICTSGCEPGTTMNGIP